MATLLWSLAKLAIAALAIAAYALYLTGFVADLLDTVAGPNLPTGLRIGLPALMIGVPTIFALFAVGVARRALIDAVRSASDVGRTITVEGEVLRTPHTTDESGSSVRSGFLAVDDGRSDHLQAYYYPALPVSQGQRVRLEVTPRLGFVKHAEVRPR